jgi:hypothetical protein
MAGSAAIRSSKFIVGVYMADFAFAKVTLMLMLAPRMKPQQEHAPGHHANAWFARCAQGPSMPEGRAERAVEANAKSMDAPRAQRHAERRDGRRAQRNQNRLPDLWPVRGQDVVLIATRSSVTMAV